MHATVLYTTIFYTSSDNLADAVKENQNALDEVSTWYSLNRLSINIKKDKAYMIVPSNREYCYDLDLSSRVQVNGERLENVHSYNYLGVNIDDRLSFTTL